MNIRQHKTIFMDSGYLLAEVQVPKSYTPELQTCLRCTITT
jgi:hypothetical protein